MRNLILAIIPLLLLPGLCLATEVSFNFAKPDAGSVYVAGTFNNWSPDADVMTKNEDGVFQITLELASGSYQYKFVADGNWIVDPNAPETADDGFGGENGVFTVGDEALVLGEGAVSVAAPAAAAAPATDATGMVKTKFRFEPKTGGVGQVFLAGTFNDWNAGKDELLDEDGDGVFELEMKLRPGPHSYKFVVDGNWLTDENAEDFEDDGFGGQNAIINVGAGARAAAGNYRVTFRYEASGQPGRVFLAGTFNDWNAEKDPMSDADGDGTWELSLVMPPGEVQYKFVVDGNWITDTEGADRFVDDGFGGQNSIIDVDERFDTVHREKGDGEIEAGSLRFFPGYPDMNRMSAGEVEVNFRTAAGDVEAVTLHLGEDAMSKRFPMTAVAGDATSEIWRATLPVHEHQMHMLMEFEVTDGETRVMLDQMGTGEGGNLFRVDLARLPVFETPDWVADGIFYQIFPERFANGNKDNDPDFSEWYYQGLNVLPESGKTNDEYFHLVEDWNNFGGLTHSPYRTDGRPDYYSFYGGDIEGVRQKLDYLVDLGVTIIYFNPITEGKSNHKYDATDYMTVDPRFATQAEFLRFVNEAHDKGIRIVVEAVFNHCGDTHWAFVDSRDKGRDSEYWDWYEWKKWPLPKSRHYKAADYYECWWGFGLHPNLNFDLSRPDGSESGVKDITQAAVNQPLVDHLLEVTRFWLEDMNVDGFRMDVPNDAPFWFWKLFREKVKTIKPDAYLVGELWGYAPDWIGPETFDATMNYKYFRDPVTSWLGQGRGNAAKFERSMAPGRTAYPSQAVRVMMNLVDSHDTVRFVTLAGDDRKLMLAALLAMSYVGAPHIWYGDEIGMEGEKDPDCRRPFYWNYEADPRRVALRDYYKKLTAARHEHRALRRGAFKLLMAEGQDYAFMREDGDERLVTMIHNEDRSGRVSLDLGAHGVADGTEYRYLVGGSDPTGRSRAVVKDGMLTLGMGPLSGALLVEE